VLAQASRRFRPLTKIFEGYPMTRDHSAVVHDLNAFRQRETSAAGGAAQTPQPAEQPQHLDALSVLARASSARLADPAQEQERIMLIASALAAGRGASHALHAWLTQLLSEHRGSHSAFDFVTTSDELRAALRHFEQAVQQTAVRLNALIPIEHRSAE
jgi:hypothetical protein